MAPYAKNAAIPFALGVLSSLWDYVVDSILGVGILNGNMSRPSDDYREEYVPSRKRNKGSAKRSRAGKTRKATGTVRRARTAPRLATRRKTGMSKRA